MTRPIRGPRSLGDGELFRLAARVLSDSHRVTRDEIESLALGLLEREERMRTYDDDTIVLDMEDLIV